MTTSVQAAVAAVIADMPNIGKGDKSPEGYQYRGIEAVTKHVQPLFAKHGVVIAPRATITDVRPSPAMKDGWQDVYMQVEWTITGPDGSTITAQTTGIGRDRADKGANKAQTQAFKYLLLHLLCIADGKDDADSHSYEDERQAGVPCPVCKDRQESRDATRDHLVAVHGWALDAEGRARPKPDVAPPGDVKDGVGHPAEDGRGEPAPPTSGTAK